MGIRSYRVALFPRNADNRREGGAIGLSGGELVEDVAHCAGEYTLDFDDLDAIILRFLFDTSDI